jgi:pyridoxine 5-phosphate synthase
MIRLGVNIDHVATLRNARGGSHPDPLLAARAAIEAGADGITAHLREDRRHIRDADVWELKRRLSVPLNLEMAVTAEMVEIASALRPHAVCLVPERRAEITTEGGLDVTANLSGIRAAAAALSGVGCRVSLFIDPHTAQIEAAASAGAAAVELHTGAFCKRPGDPAEFRRLQDCAALAHARGLECHAGHGLDYDTARRVAGIPEIVELNIGHFLVGAAVFDGLKAAVAAMVVAMREGRAATQGVGGQ